MSQTVCPMQENMAGTEEKARAKTITPNFIAGHAVNALITEIESIGWETDSTQLRKIISGFVAHADQYRMYLSHPELRLPRTNNTGETLMGGIPESYPSYAGILKRAFTQTVA